jgi:signal-transduction protein with cAMP-binding, CBS, and nucleotidyltransferase domain
MLHSLEQFTRKYVAFNATELFTLAHLFQPLSFNENDYVIKKSQSISNIYFLDSGVLKSYSENNDSIHQLKFYFNPIFFSDLTAIINKNGSTKNVVTVKKSNVFMANFEDILQLNEKSEKHKLFFAMIFEDDYMFNSKFIR